MTMRSWIRNVFTRPATRPLRKAPYRVRPGLEALEDRLTPSTYFVNNSADNLLPGSLRSAINQANLDPGSTINITSQVTSPINLNRGELSITTNMTIQNTSGRAIEVNQQIPSARVFHVSGSSALNVTFMGGSASTPLIVSGGLVRGENGAGILDDTANSNLALTYVQVTGNRALPTSDSDNPVGGIGGGIYTMGNVTLVASSITYNQGGAGGGGVGINNGALTLTQTSFVSYNQASLGTGGGIAVATGSVTVSGGSHVEGNSARDVGGIMVGTTPGSGDVAVSVSGGSTVNGNSSTAGQQQSPKNLGGGGIAVVDQGAVLIDASQVNGNQTFGMYSGGIVVGVGDVTVTNGSQVNGNSNNGPGGGIAANFGGTVTVSGQSQVNGNTGSAFGGGIVNFAGPGGSVAISGASQVSYNTLTNGETIGRAIATFLEAVYLKGSFHDFAVAAGGVGGAAMISGLRQLDREVKAAAGPIRDAVQRISHPLGVLVAGGGIATLLAPVSVTQNSQVNNNFSGLNVLNSHHHIIGLAGGIFHLLGSVTLNQGHVDDNRAPFGDGGGIWIRVGSLSVSNNSTVSGNSAGGDGGGIWNGGLLNILSSTVSNNTAGEAGGGLFNTSSGRATVRSSTFQGNQATLGGGMANEGRLTVSQSTLSDNTATTNGGGIYWSGGKLTLVDVIFSNNSPNNVFKV